MSFDYTIILALIPLVILEVVGKYLALWKAAKNGHRNWYIALLILNTAGLLPVIYLKFYSKKKRKLK